MNIFIGGTAAQTETACHSLESWNALLEALAAGDRAEVLRITLGERPTMVPTAALRPVAADALSEFARQYWARQATAKPAARAAPVINVVEFRGES